MTILYIKGDEQFRVPDSMSYDPNEEKYYSVGYRPHVWASEKEYVRANGLVVPSVSNGFMYECYSSGVSGTDEPNFATTEGDLTSDGTVVWKANPYTLKVKAGDVITDSYWQGVEAGIVIDNDTFVNGVMTEFRLTAVPVGVDEITVTNFITVFRADGKVEKFNRSLIIPVREL